MPLDGLTLGLVADELRAALVNGRIDRIVQPERDELNLTIRNNGQNHLLLLSASADCARAHLTAQKKTGPLEPPALCMLLRKHITGGRVADVRQIHCDRILEITIEHYDELGERATKRLVCEFMGKHSNLIFVGGDGRIIDSARRVNEAMSSVREVLPGLRYEDPPAHGKLPFADVPVGALAAVKFEDAVVHPQMGGLAAAGRADHRGDPVRPDVEIVVEQRLDGFRIEEVQIPYRYFDRTVIRFSVHDVSP